MKNSVFCFVCSLFCVNTWIINVWGCPCEVGQHVWILKCVAVSQIKLMCVLEEPKTSAKARLQLLFVCLCVCVSQQAEWHTAGSVKLGMTYFTINQRLPHSSLRNISNTLPHMLKHMCRARRHHVLWVNYENWLETFQTMSEEGTVKEKNWAPASTGSSWSGHKSFTMNSKSP